MRRWPCGPLAGPYASALFALGLLNASVFSAAILPLSTAYVVCEAFGWEPGVNRSLREAPIFFGIYTALIVLGAGIILLPIQSLVQTMMASQTLNGVLLPVILMVMLRLINEQAPDGPVRQRSCLQHPGVGDSCGVDPLDDGPDLGYCISGVSWRMTGGWAHGGADGFLCSRSDFSLGQHFIHGRKPALNHCQPATHDLLNLGTRIGKAATVVLFGAQERSLPDRQYARVGQPPVLIHLQAALQRFCERLQPRRLPASAVSGCPARARSQANRRWVFTGSTTSQLNKASPAARTMVSPSAAGERLASAASFIVSSSSGRVSTVATRPMPSARAKTGSPSPRSLLMATVKS